MHTTPRVRAPEIEHDHLRDPVLGYDPPEAGGFLRCLAHGIPSPLIRWHHHDEYELHLIMETSGKVFVGDYIGHFQPGHLVLTGPRVPHNWITTDAPEGGVALRDRVIQFAHEPIEQACELFPEFKEILPLLEQARYGIEFFGVSEMALAHFERVASSRGLARIAGFCEFMGMLARCKDFRLLSSVQLQCAEDDESMAQVNAVVSYISEHCGEPLSMAEVCERFRMPESRFSRFFRRATGNTFTDFVNRMRISKACQLLMDTDRYVTTICYEVGFNNVANFNRRFLEIKGMTPTDFRRQSASRFGLAETGRTDMYLGIDLGTSALKAVLLSDDGHIVAQQSAPLEVSRPHPQWSEQSPADWWRALGIALGELARAQPAAMRAVRAIGLSGQMHGAVLLDAAGEVLRPAILWNDGRSEPQCAELAARVPRLGRIAGNLAMPGFTAPKLLWVKDHQPQVFAKISRVLLPKDWLRFKLSGEFFTDCSDASGTLWLDVGARDWSDELLAACDLTRAQMPALVEGSAPAGRLKADVAERFGLTAGVVIAGGGGDNAASAVGMGATAPGDGFVSLGTSGVIFLCSDRFLPAPESAVHAFCHALPGAWHQMSVMLSAASALRWVTQLTDRRDEAELLAEVEALDERALDQAPLFLPYLAGERTPHNDAHAQGVLFGLTHEHGAAAIGYAVIEGVAFGLLDGWHTLDESTRALAKSLDLVGGGARSATWARLLATLLDRPLTKRDGGEAGGALGAARLAWLADGGDLARVCAKTQVIESFQPQPARRAPLMARYARFRKLYPLLKDSFRDQ